MSIRILLVDDHTLFRSGLKALLSRQADFEIVGEASDGLEGVKLAEQLKPDLVLLDLDMPVMNGTEALAQMLAANRELPVVMLTVSEDAEDLKEAFVLGARGYLVKNIDAEYLVNGVRQVVAGESVMSPEMTSKFVNGIRAKHLSLMPEVRPETVKSLTERERQILGCLAQGASNREMANLLNMSESTVKAHLQRIMRRFDFSSRVQAAVFAAERHMDRYLLESLNQKKTNNS
ncbi:response regulator [Parasutterella secunda]|jgi:two-component system nitrate/nitrite response regulator NarL|uniref:response regulator n=1 Tax=Parasutterella secunda TaxID=626947 RepID=UPI00033E5E85|nr:response regulator transcription factor [Parasutterella secunda]CDE76335.1 narL [Sutterella sp. CAG:521]HIR22028.1 response regulator transcription factor [Candidatus Aphodousia faecalis]MCR8920333.1 response regulator transcription factor [Parasutterella secunda]MDM8112354.1 response regulator transcription factor [Parasutterella secunda]MDM8217526.1 response regulator transcription factor [Parasutterella secunda]